MAAGTADCVPARQRKNGKVPPRKTRNTRNRIPRFAIFRVFRVFRGSFSARLHFVLSVLSGSKSCGCSMEQCWRFMARRARRFETTARGYSDQELAGRICGLLRELRGFACDHREGPISHAKPRRREEVLSYGRAASTSGVSNCGQRLNALDPDAVPLA